MWSFSCFTVSLHLYPFYCPYTFWENCLIENTDRIIQCFLPFSRSTIHLRYVDFWTLETLWSMICSIWNRKSIGISCSQYFFHLVLVVNKSNVCNHPPCTVFFICWVDQEGITWLFQLQFLPAISAYLLTTSFSMRRDLVYLLLFVHSINPDKCILTCPILVSCRTQPSVKDCLFCCLCSFASSRISCHCSHQSSLLLNI